MKLNLGCGKVILKGYKNLDREHIDLNHLPYDFKSNSIEKIHMSHILEHLDDPDSVIKELYRILQPGGELNILVPHFSASGAFDPFHKTYWNNNSFETYNKGAIESTSKDKNQNLFTIKEKKINFFKGKVIWNYLIEPLVNINEFTRRTYDNHLAFIFPANEIEVTYII